MNTTQAQQLIADTAAGTLLTEPTYTWRESWWTWRTFADRWGVEVANTIHAAIKTHQGEAAATSFATEGFDIRSQATRDGLAALTALGAVTAEQCEAVLASGRQETDSPLARYGVANPTTAEALAEAQRIVAFDTGETRQACYGVLAKYNAMMAKLDQLRESGAACPTPAELEAML